MADSVLKFMDHLSSRTRGRDIKPEDEATMKSVFHECDEGHKGYLSKEDLKVAYVNLFGYKPSKFEIQDIISRWSSSESECKLRLDQFLIIMQEKWKQSEVDDHIRSAFLAFDSKCQGFLTIDDLIKAFSQVAPHMSKTTLESAFREVDRDGDGRVSYKDFEFMMKYRSCDEDS